MATTESHKMPCRRVSMEIPSVRFSRRRSTFKGVARTVTEVMSLHKRNTTEDETAKAAKRTVENTYRMDPGDGQGFSVPKVERAVQMVLEANLCQKEYEHSECAALTQLVTDRIRYAIKDMEFPRYKIVCNVIIGQNTQQDMQLASRAVWNSDTDSYACVNYKNSSLFAVALVYGVYFE